jgi:hypothetical protein
VAAAASTSVQLAVNVVAFCALVDCKRADDSRMKEWDSFMMVSYRVSWLAFAFILLAMLSCW